ncbi:MAG: prepilin-type N-terminal cleavage/methylation domain-containing protein [Thermodesulfobacteriota bacterium]|nr:prepilin-type N-terminal cleavage/methylation domain-containing protein [Thermodesulfobacteriota bacterium]
MKPNQEQERAKLASGFTLIEVLIAIAVFSVGLLAIGSLQISGTQANSSAKWHTEAATWASDRIEKVIQLPYGHADLVDLGGPHPDITDGIYTMSWTVTDDDPIPNTKSIRFTVRWTERGRPKDLSLTYYRANL